ncbi:hypothetical protein [Nonomuraea sp. NPDC049400]|uniref:hypothetical protein n=1 Tax=Nonomuraea sp. NPDC049400 TaxID=3364352 RepID=UPI0037A386A0
MRVLILTLAVALVLTAIPMTYLAIRWVARRRRDQKDLALCRKFLRHIQARAQEHQELGDPFAVIVADDILHFTRNNTLPEGNKE